MSVVSTIIGSAERVPLPDMLIRGVSICLTAPKPRTGSRAFFTGGVMPSHHLIRRYTDLFEVEQEWRWNGTHYRRTAEHWPKNFDASSEEIERILRPVYGRETALWMRRWRWFFLATSGLFGYAGGSEWGISHYRMKAA
jgi:cyclopropane-fatty-acyl-phospholipid synthase